MVRMLGHSWVLLAIVLVIVLVIFGPGKLGDIGGALGKSFKEFRKSSSAEDTTPPEGRPKA